MYPVVFPTSTKDVLSPPLFPHQGVMFVSSRTKQSGKRIVDIVLKIPETEISWPESLPVEVPVVYTLTLLLPAIQGGKGTRGKDLRADFDDHSFYIMEFPIPFLSRFEVDGIFARYTIEHRLFNFTLNP